MEILEHHKSADALGIQLLYEAMSIMPIAPDGKEQCLLRQDHLAAVYGQFGDDRVMKALRTRGIQELGNVAEGCHGRLPLLKIVNGQRQHRPSIFDAGIEQGEFDHFAIGTDTVPHLIVAIAFLAGIADVERGAHLLLHHFQVLYLQKEPIGLNGMQGVAFKLVAHLKHAGIGANVVHHLIRKAEDHAVYRFALQNIVYPIANGCSTEMALGCIVRFHGR